jgi:hypothetical protein
MLAAKVMRWPRRARRSNILKEGSRFCVRRRKLSDLGKKENKEKVVWLSVVVCGR